ncbi:MAG: GspE/PulE family protein, partial [Halanaerobiales bacterium]
MLNRVAKRLGDLLQEFNFITEEKLQEAYKKLQKTDKSFSEFLVDSGYIEEEDLITVMEIQLGIDRVNMADYDLGPQLSQYIPENMARHYCVAPLAKDEDVLKVAMAEPNDIIAIDDMEMVSDLKIQPFISSRKEIKRAQGLIYTLMEHDTDDLIEGLSEYQEEEPQLDEIKKMVEDAPIVRLTNIIITQAIQMRASDIHIEPQAKEVKVRYRIDGVLRENMIAPKYSQAALISRIKIMADLDITKRKVPQDGRIKLNFNGLEIDMRVSTLPTVYGESVVIRILNKEESLLDLSRLGLSDENLTRFKNMIYNPFGIILVTGPTGSGKSTTLFAVLNELNSSDKKLITIEDPVEYQMKGVNQVQVNPKQGLTFGGALRSILRQDPDIVMVGEIRDEETAMIAVRAALTGHLVLSTLHTNDSVSTITRLVDMGIPPYLLAATLKGVVAQRLVRRLCENCREVYAPSVEEKAILGINNYQKIYR